MKQIIGIWILVWCFLWMVPVMADGAESSDMEQSGWNSQCGQVLSAEGSESDQTADISLPDMTEMQQAGEEWLDGVELSLPALIRQLMAGEDPLTAVELDGLLTQLVKNMGNDMTKLFRQILLLILCSAVFHMLAEIAADSRAGEMGFYILFMLLCALLLQEFTVDSRRIAELLQILCTFMQTSCAAYSMVILGASGSLSTVFFEQGLLFVITVTQWLVARIFLPVLVCSVLIGICDKISEERLLSVLTEGMEKFVRWGMQTVLAVVTGVQILRNMLAPAFDTVRRSVLGRAAEAVPGIGSMVNAAAEMLLASAVLIRNCMGIVILLVLVIGSLSPVLVMAMKCGAFYLLAALAQPVADRRIVSCLKVMARGYGLCVRILSGTVLLFFITVAVMTQVS